MVKPDFETVCALATNAQHHSGVPRDLRGHRNAHYGIAQAEKAQQAMLSLGKRRGRRDLGALFVFWASIPVLQLKCKNGTVSVEGEENAHSAHAKNPWTL